MQLNKTQNFSKSIIFILSPELFFITHNFIDSSFINICIHFFFQFKFPSISHSLTFLWTQLFILCFLGGARGKESACQCRKLKTHRFGPWVGKTLWSSKWQHTPVFLPGKFHGRRSPWDHRESDMTEQLSTHTHIRCYVCKQV